MARADQGPITALIMKYGRASFVNALEGLEAFGGSTDALEAAESVEIAPFLGQLAQTSARSERTLVVRAHDEAATFRTSALLEVRALERRAFYRLPQVLRNSGCPDWICGIVVMDTEQTSSSTSQELAIWIDLSALAMQLKSKEHASPPAEATTTKEPS